jgi:hypothetical protein
MTSHIDEIAGIMHTFVCVATNKNCELPEDIEYEDCVRIKGSVKEGSNIGGYVGINNSDPKFHLDVNGNINISKQLYV